MKHLLFCLSLLISCSLYAQTNIFQDNDLNPLLDEETVQSLVMMKALLNDAPAYELYKTQNMWTFLKLETSTGKIWQVQYAVGDGDAFQTVLNGISVAYDGAEISGRFKLYPTENIYNFILLDTSTGRVWQAQWSHDPSNRGIIPIY